MSHENIITQLQFYTLVLITVLLALGACVASWWFTRTVRRYQR